MKLDAMEIKMSTSIPNSIFGSSTHRADTVYLYKVMFEVGQVDTKKAVGKMFGVLKDWNDTIEISVKPENGTFTRTLFLTRDYSDRKNGTITVAKCDKCGHFGSADREHVSLNIAKKWMIDYINGFEFC